MKIYIASFFETKERLLPVREMLQSMGHVVVSTWLDEANHSDELMPDKETFWRNLASKDLAELHSADCIILDTLDVNPRGGREVEFGYALSFYHKKFVCIVGPFRNVFHTLAHRQFDSWADAEKFFVDPNQDKLNKGRIKDPVQEAKVSLDPDVAAVKDLLDKNPNLSEKAHPMGPALEVLGVRGKVEPIFPFGKELHDYEGQN